MKQIEQLCQRVGSLGALRWSLACYLTTTSAISTAAIYYPGDLCFRRLSTPNHPASAHSTIRSTIKVSAVQSSVHSSKASTSVQTRSRILLVITPTFLHLPPPAGRSPGGGPARRGDRLYQSEVLLFSCCSTAVLQQCCSTAGLFGSCSASERGWVSSGGDRKVYSLQRLCCQVRTQDSGLRTQDSGLRTQDGLCTHFLCTALLHIPLHTSHRHIPGTNHLTTVHHELYGILWFNISAI